MDEGIIAVNVGWNLMVLWLGTLGLVLYGRGGRGLLISGVWLYHVAAISLLAGLTRYRVPLEPSAHDLRGVVCDRVGKSLEECIDSEKR